MASEVLKKLIPISRSAVPSDSDYLPDVSIECSMALEYNGPPVDHSLPRAVPLDIDLIPTAIVAAEVASNPPSMLSNLSLPVVKPIARTVPREVDLEARRVWDSTGPSTSSPRERSGGMKAAGGGGGNRDEGVDSMGRVEILSSVGVGDGSTTFRGSRGSALSCSFAKSSPDGIESSGSLGFSDSRDHSHELSGSSDMVETLFDCNEIEGGLKNYMNPGNWISTDPSATATPQRFSDEVSCSELEEAEVFEDDGGHLRHRNNNNNRTNNVTFLDPESIESVVMEEEEQGLGAPEDSESISLERRPVPQRVVKKGLCCRCLKGNRFTEKEVCLVCGAKYCCNCIVREMGSMPEGRKCLPCIGYPIDESKRKMLGKCSRLLKKLLSEDEVNQIMNAEVSCIVNQLPPELICVNGKPLDHEELIFLQTCPIPPKTLKPGNYWYDRVSGFWGKEGHKPCQIISPSLNVGDSIKKNASNGNTNLIINNREITASELLMLRSAGVNCAGISSLWVSADGSYTEEGMNFEKGRIWGKKRTKVVCTFLSLPTPESPKADKDQTNKSDRALARYLEQMPPYKFLLVGNGQSGTSTIFKQARVLYNVPFSAEERENLKCMIQSNLYGYLAILLEGREQFEEEHLEEMRRESIHQPSTSGDINEAHGNNIYSISPRLKAFSDWLIKIMVSGNLGIVFPAATREYAPYVEELWKDSAIQATYNRRNELELPRVANYFLDKAVEIAKVEYEPSDTDILYAEGISSSNGIAYVDFTFPRAAHDAYMESTDQQDIPSSQYQLIRAHAKSLGEKCKWLEMFEDVGLVAFCVSLTDYDEYEMDANGSVINKMLASKKLFERIVTHPTLKNMIFLLILNKFDLLEDSIEHVPLNRCEWFADFNPVMSNHSSARSNRNNIPPLAQRAFHYVAVKFKRLFSSLTGGRKLYVSRVTGLEPDTVGEALSYAKEIIRWEEEKFTFSFNNELSSESIEASSSS